MVRAQGTATAEGLRQARELGFVSRLARHATGGAAYAATLAVRSGTPEVQVTSNLQGLALNLPAPLAKTAEAVLPLRYENALLRDSATMTRRRPTSCRSTSAASPRSTTCATWPATSRGCCAAPSPSASPRERRRPCPTRA